MSEQAVHKLKEYELSFDQTRWLKMQASELFRLGLYGLYGLGFWPSVSAIQRSKSIASGKGCN
jgi:hypothetical protein